MANEKIEVLRKKLNDMIIAENADRDELQKLSEELDVAIVQAMKERQVSKELKLSAKMLEEIKTLLKDLKLFKKMYQSMRIVDPINHKVFNLKDSQLIDSDSKCHHFWNRNKICKNCISSRAYLQNDTIFKLEINKNKVYMIMAVPIEIKSEKFVVEMLKDTTDTLFIEDGSVNKKIIDLIQKINKINM